MQFLLSDQEAIDVIRNGIRREDGLLLIRLPAVCLQDSDTQLVLTFSPDSHTANWGRRSTRLSPILYSLLHCLHIHKRISFEAIQNMVWDKKVSDSVIYKACSRLSSRLFDAEIPFTASAQRSNVVLEQHDLS